MAKEKHQFCFYNECLDKSSFLLSSFLLWRHDIDMSLSNAVKFAQIEYEENVRSTYFIWLHSPYYHYWKKDNAKLILEILSKGHKLGLHFDPWFYDVFNTRDIAHEAYFLGRAFQTNIEVFSFHNPTKELIENNNSLLVWSLINTYSDFFYNKCQYISDSNGVWNSNLEEALNTSRLQVLTHPVWWSDTPLTPEEKRKGALTCKDKFTA